MIKEFAFAFLSGLLLIESCSVNKAKNINGSFENYRIAGEISLFQNSNGFNGKLELLVDKSLPYDIQSYSPNDDSIDHRPALLRIAAESNETIFLDTLARAVAWLDPGIVLRNYPDWKAVTVDYSTGLGSYNGPVTSFFAIKDSKVEWLSAVEKSTGQINRIRLLRSLKTDWRIRQGATTDILSIACRPNTDADDQIYFEIIYSRYFVNGNQWERVDKKEKGFWELIDSTSFPAESKFIF